MVALEPEVETAAGMRQEGVKSVEVSTDLVVVVVVFVASVRCSASVHTASVRRVISFVVGAASAVADDFSCRYCRRKIIS